MASAADAQHRQQRAEFEERILSAAEEDDPLAVYVDYVQWLQRTYSQGSPHSGLTELLKRATDEFLSDGMYKTDLRYLKLWALYARNIELTEAITVFATLVKNGIGSSYALLYEEYASTLESAGRPQDAEAVYQMGLKRKARPTERLKSRFMAFQQRNGNAASAPRHSVSGLGSGRTGSTGSDSGKATSNTSTFASSSTAASRYAVMMAPPQPGKRPEKLQFDLSLLYAPETGEFCASEARARSLGLLGKTWAPLAPDLPKQRVMSNLELSSPERTLHAGKARKSLASRRKSLMHGEPTVTINTKEALADVFGMYNSPEKTMRVKPGSKHAPLKTIEPIATFTPSPEDLTPKQRPRSEDKKKENQQSVKKFVPFMDPQASSMVTPKQVSSSENDLRSSQKSRPPTDLSKVFTPVQTKIPALAPLRDVFTDDHGKPQQKAKPILHERAKSHQEFFSPSPPDPNPVTPFKVFSRPDTTENAAPTPQLGVPTPTPLSKSVFQPFRDIPVIQPEAPGRELLDHPQEQEEIEAEPEHFDYREQEVETERYDDDFDDDDDPPEDYDVPLPSGDSSDEGNSFRDPPLGGRFGQFTVMTPITERTFEFTSTRSAFNTPIGHMKRVSEADEDLGDTPMLYEGEESEGTTDDEANQPLAPLDYRQQQDISTSIEDMTGALSLQENLAASASFRPPNPCNPFDPPILNSILSRLTSDVNYHDLRHEQAELLDGLQKFAKKSRKTSGGSRGSSGFDGSVHPLLIDGHKFLVSGKLGEGGFGAVFRAADVGMKGEDDDTDDEDDVDEDEASLVAVKVVKPRNLWEYHVLRRLHSAMPSSLRSSIILPHALYAFKDESFLIMELCAQGPLLDIVNKASTAGISQQGGCLDELLVIFFTIELLRVVEAMHTIGFIHGDLKIDNCLLRLEDVPGGPANWTSVYEPSGKGGWGHKGLKIIDFGRTIDTRLFPMDQVYVADWSTSEQDCPEIQENRPWTYQTDYFGLAGIIYCMLFGKYIPPSCLVSEPGATGEPRLKVSTPLKRYWQGDLWSNLFDILLNPKQVRRDGRLPVCHELGLVRQQMEGWLQANCNRTSNTLKGLLKKVELCCL